MRLNHFINGTLAATALLLASCATPHLAGNNTADDVYNTTAEAKVYKYSPPAQPALTEQLEDNPDYIASTPTYDMDYSSRIDRFYYGNHRPYFDNYYNFYGYNSWYNPYDVRLGFNIGFGYNPWYTHYDRYGFGNPYYSYWGPYSYYNPWYNRYGNGYYGNGYYGNGYYGNGYYGDNWGSGNVIVGRNENRPRPTRGSDSNAGRYDGTVPSRGDASNNNFGRPTRAEGYNPTTNGTINRPTTTGSGSRPATSSSNEGRPRRESQAPQSSRPIYTPAPTQQSSPPSNTGSSSSGQSGNSGGSTRPTRSGGRG